jgi:hypothetical protein
MKLLVYTAEELLKGNADSHAETDGTRGDHGVAGVWANYQ